jgi:hypothetical protein
MSEHTNVQETINQADTASSAVDTNTNQTQETASFENNRADVPQSDQGSSDANNSAGTSAAGDTDAKKKATLLDVVKNVANKGKLDSDSSTEGEQTKSALGSEADAAGKDGQQQKVDPEKQAEKLPFHNHPRWREMISERDALKPKAEQYDKITSFMTSNGLSAQEMAEGIGIMALMKNNPAEAYKALRKHAEALAVYAGEALPEDIKAKMDDGFIDADTARELARLKAEREFMESRQRQEAERQEQQYADLQRKQIHDAVATWEASEKARDPDWSKKYEMVMERAQVLIQNGQPKNPQEAVEFAKRALADVNARLRPLSGRSIGLRAPTSSMSSASARPVPRSLEDAVRMAIQN